MNKTSNNRDAIKAAVLTSVCILIAALVGAYATMHKASGVPNDVSKDVPTCTLRGEIREKKTRKCIAGATVTVKWNGFIGSAPPTDTNGVYVLTLREPPQSFTIEVEAEGYKPMPAENHSIAVTSGTGTWDAELTPELNQAQPPIDHKNIDLKKPNPKPPFQQNFEIKKDMDSSISVGPGDRVHITAEGSINTGDVLAGHAGEITPEGKRTLGDRMSPYKTQGGSQYLYGSLLWRVSGEHSWQCYSLESDVTIQSQGHLMFTINKKWQPYHTGSYKVEVKVTPRS